MADRVHLMEEREGTPRDVGAGASNIMLFTDLDIQANLNWLSVERPYENPAHYHRTDQFQVVLEGKMEFPDHDLGPLSVHYTDNSRPYGPFTGAKEGYRFAVLRRETVGVFFMHQAGAKNADPSGREYVAYFEDTPWEEQPDGSKVKRLLREEEHGVAAEVVECPPGAVLTRHRAPYGEYMVVHAGEVNTAGRTVGKNSVRYTEGEGALEPIVCGPEGARLIFTRYDRPVGTSSA